MVATIFRVSIIDSSYPCFAANCDNVDKQQESNCRIQNNFNYNQQCRESFNNFQFCLRRLLYFVSFTYGVIVRIVKSRRLSLAEHVARMQEGRSAFRTLKSKPTARTLLGRILKK